MRIWYEKSSIFDRINGIKLLSTRQLKKYWKILILLLGTCANDLAVLSGDYFVVKFVRTYSMYYSTPPCGGRQTPTYGMNCTKAKLRAKIPLRH